MEGEGDGKECHLNFPVNQTDWKKFEDTPRPD